MNLGLHSSLLLASKQHFDSFRFVVAHSTARTVKTHIHPQQRTQFSLLIASKLQIDSFRFAVARSTARTVKTHIHPQQRSQFSLLIASKLQIESFYFAVAHSTVRTVISIHIHDNGNYSVHYLQVNYLIANCILSFDSYQLHQLFNYILFFVLKFLPHFFFSKKGEQPTIFYLNFQFGPIFAVPQGNPGKVFWSGV